MLFYLCPLLAWRERKKKPLEERSQKKERRRSKKEMRRRRRLITSALEKEAKRGGFRRGQEMGKSLKDIRKEGEIERGGPHWLSFIY